MSKTIKFVFSIVAIMMLLTTIGCKPATTGTTSGTGSSANPVTIHIITMDQAAMSTDDEQAIATAFEAENPGIKVQWEFVAYEAVHDKIVTGLATTPPAYDAIMVDVVWPDEFIKKGYLLDVTDRIDQATKDAILPAAWNGVTRNGKIYGMPWLLDTKYFYYNKDILQKAGFSAPPTTWEELITQAKVIQQKKLAEFPIAWSWKQAEAAICDFTILLVGNGGTFLDANGKPAFNNEKGVQVLTWMKQTLDEGISNPSSSVYGEGDVETNFISGKSAFMLDWLSGYSNGQDPTKSAIVDQFAFAPAPVFEAGKAAGIMGAGVDGSTAFGVTATSPNADAAWKFLTYLSSEAVQVKYSAKQLPIWKAEYTGDNLTKLLAATPSNPITLPAFLAQFPFASERPNVSYYAEASAALQQALQDVFAGNKTPQQALDDAAAIWVQLAGQ
jgi:multiple sugar transport system substrate-binding protein